MKSANSEGSYEVQNRKFHSPQHSRLSYKPWYALAEFVDNSTQSFTDHSDALDNSSSPDGIDQVIITYDNRKPRPF